MTEPKAVTLSEVLQDSVVPSVLVLALHIQSLGSAYKQSLILPSIVYLSRPLESNDYSTKVHYTNSLPLSSHCRWLGTQEKSWGTSSCGLTAWYWALTAPKVIKLYLVNLLAFLWMMSFGNKMQAQTRYKCFFSPLWLPTDNAFCFCLFVLERNRKAEHGMRKFQQGSKNNLLSFQ